MLAGERVNLWGIEPFDLALIREWVSDPELVHLTMSSPFLSGSAELEKWYEQTQRDPTVRTFAIKTKDGVHVGNIGLEEIDVRAGSGELGIFLGREIDRRKGHGRDAVRTLLTFAFREMGLHRVSARVAVFNERALAFFRGCGFTEEGRLRESYLSRGTRWDVILLGMLARELPHNPDQRMSEGGANDDPADRVGSTGDSAASRSDSAPDRGGLD